MADPDTKLTPREFKSAVAHDAGFTSVAHAGQVKGVVQGIQKITV